MPERQIRGRDIRGAGCVSSPLTQSAIVLWALHTSTMGLSDRRHQKKLRVRNSAFVSSAHIVADKEGAATGNVGEATLKVQFYKQPLHKGRSLSTGGKWLQKVTLIGWLYYTLRCRRSWLRFNYLKYLKQWNCKSTTPTLFSTVNIACTKIKYKM